jgi:hypothetical protein
MNDMLMMVIGGIVPPKKVVIGIVPPKKVESSWENDLPTQTRTKISAKVGGLGLYNGIVTRYNRGRVVRSKKTANQKRS